MYTICTNIKQLVDELFFNYLELHDETCMHVVQVDNSIYRMLRPEIKSVGFPLYFGESKVKFTDILSGINCELSVLVHKYVNIYYINMLICLTTRNCN